MNPESTLTLTLATGQILAVALSGAAETQVLAAVAAAYAAAQAAAEMLTRTYRLGSEPTPGLPYNDLLSVRAKCSDTKLREALKRPIARGGLRHQLNGTRYVVTELAVRE